MTFRIRLKSLLLAAAASMLLAGCVNIAGGSMGASAIVFLIALLGLGIAACSDDTAGQEGGWKVGEDTGEPDVRDASDVRDVRDVPDTREDGTWESCCEGGQVSSCFCPANMACNYGWYDLCGDGTCTVDPAGCDDGDAGDAGDAADAPDAPDAPDASDSGEAGDADDARDGTWQSCCRGGKVDSCFCPAGLACNYGWYTDCGDGTCVNAGSDQCTDDAGF